MTPRTMALTLMLAGTGLVVAAGGEIMTMPGLPRALSSEKIFLNGMSQIEGLFLNTVSVNGIRTRA